MSVQLIPSHPVWVDSTGRPVFVSSSSWDLQALKTCWKEGKIGRDAVWIFWGLPLRFGRTVSDSFLIPAGSRISWLTFFQKQERRRRKKVDCFNKIPFFKLFLSFFLFFFFLSFESFRMLFIDVLSNKMRYFPGMEKAPTIWATSIGLFTQNHRHYTNYILLGNEMEWKPTSIWKHI